MFADLSLARRIEAGDALNAAGCGESIAVCGGFATFSGVGSPLTHAVGLGFNGPVAAAEFDRMEDFYRSRGVPVNIELCPLADPTLLDLIASREYRIIECNNVLAGPVVGSPDPRVRVAEPFEFETWNRTMLEGFFAPREMSEIELDVGRRLLCLDHMTAWLATVDGEPAAAAAMNIRGKLALLFADSTLERFRGRGLHLALIRARLRHAALAGCDLATSSTQPGSISQRNYERAGFRILYTKLNMQRDF